MKKTKTKVQILMCACIQETHINSQTLDKKPWIIFISTSYQGSCFYPYNISTQDVMFLSGRCYLRSSAVLIRSQDECNYSGW